MKKKAKVNASILIIGNEILSGRTQDTNTSTLANWLNSLGVNVVEVRVIPDVEKTIVETLNILRSKYDYVFTTGGIGPTHDDITTDCVAQAFGKQVTIRSDAFKILKKYYDEKGIELNEARLRMARIPETADLIENSISGAPGYIIENVYVMAGVPKIFQSMLKTILPKLKKGSPTLSRSVKLHKGEGDIALELEQIVREFSKLNFGSYPFNEKGVHGTNIVIRGKDDKLMIKAEEKVRTLA